MLTKAGPGLFIVYHCFLRSGAYLTPLSSNAAIAVRQTAPPLRWQPSSKAVGDALRCSGMFSSFPVLSLLQTNNNRKMA